MVGWFTLAGLLATLGLTFSCARGVALQRLVRQRRPGNLLQETVPVVGRAERARLADAPAERASTGARRSITSSCSTSVLGMLVLASARELILLFVSFELMSIPLYVLTGFVKREDAAPEAALKFFLVGTASSAVIAYGMSFIFGVTGSTELSAIPGALATGDPMMLLGMTLLLAGLGFKIAAFPFHMWAPDAYEAAQHAVCRVARRRAEGRRVSSRSSGSTSRALARPRSSGCRSSPPSRG